MKTLRSVINKLACRHSWESCKEIDIFIERNGKKQTVGVEILYVCEKCGKMKQVKFGTYF